LFAVHPGHHEIQKNQGGSRARLNLFKSIESVRGDVHAIAFGFQDDLQELPNIGVVVNNKD
jgi:hypothetical protein